MEVISAQPRNVGRSVTVDVMEILRVHGLDELAQQDDNTLNTYKQMLAIVIGRCESTLRTNIVREFAAKIHQDRRLYVTIQDKINTILTARFNQKKSI